MDIKALWSKQFDRKLRNSDLAKLNALPLDNQYQFGWLLNKYAQDTVYGFVDDFCDYVQSRAAAGDIPNPLSCAAMLTNNTQLMELAIELETLLGAWFKDEGTDKRIDEIKEQIEAALA